MTLTPERWQQVREVLLFSRTSLCTPIPQPAARCCHRAQSSSPTSCSRSSARAVWVSSIAPAAPLSRSRIVEKCGCCADHSRDMPSTETTWTRSRQLVQVTSAQSRRPTGDATVRDGDLIGIGAGVSGRPTQSVAGQVSLCSVRSADCFLSQVIASVLAG